MNTCAIPVRFEFDHAKSLRNAEKHGIDFYDAQRIWDRTHLIIPGRSEDEVRSLVIGLIDGVFWTAVITYREDVVRLISVRRARINEVRTFRSALYDA